MELDDDYFGSISERATIGSAPGELSVSLEDVNDGDSKVGALKEDSIEELDSPESIDRIDQEDCFSWEDDRLSLMIDVEKNPQNVDENAGLASSFKEVTVMERNSNFVRNSTKLARSQSLENQVHDNSKVIKSTPNSTTPSKENSRESSPGKYCAFDRKCVICCPDDFVVFFRHTLALATDILSYNSLLIVWCLTQCSTVFQLHRSSLCTYPCFAGVLLTSTSHSILSKPVAAFPHNHC